MEDRKPNEGSDAPPEPEEMTTPETSAEVSLRIYVASLSDYNNGRLHGVWIDAYAEPDEIFTDINKMLEQSVSDEAEEFAIFDHDGFFPWRPGEYESIETVSKVAQGIAAHGRAYAHWVGSVGTSESAVLDRFEDSYFGFWESIEEYARCLVDDVGMWSGELVPDSLSAYVHFDYEGFADDLVDSGDITISEGDGGVYVFEGHL